MIKMPGESYQGTLPALTGEEEGLRDALRVYIYDLAGQIGERNYIYYDNLNAACDYLENMLDRTGIKVQRLPYEAMGVTFFNLEAEIPGAEKADEVVVIGAHYDSVEGSAGANDNGSGVAAVLAMAEGFSGRRFPRTLRFVLFVNEEPPFFMTGQMGSQVYAKSCRQKARQRRR